MKKPQIKEDTEFVVVCSYCGIHLKEPDANKQNALKIDLSNESHGICPACLLEHHPQQYLEIQREWRMRIKSEYKKGYPEFNDKLKKRK